MFEMIKFLEYLKPSFASKPKGECSYFKSVSRKPNKWKKFTSSFLSNCIVFPNEHSNLRVAVLLKISKGCLDLSERCACADAPYVNGTISNVQRLSCNRLLLFFVFVSFFAIEPNVHSDMPCISYQSS